MKSKKLLNTKLRRLEYLINLLIKVINGKFHIIILEGGASIVRKRVLTK